MPKNKQSKSLQPSLSNKTLRNVVIRELVNIWEYSKHIGVKFYLDDNALFKATLKEQMLYHKWVLAKKIPKNERWRNYFLDRTANKDFPKFIKKTKNKKNYEENHARFNHFLLSIVPRNEFQDEEYDKWRKWCARMTKVIMLIHYKFYRYDKELGKFVDKKKNTLKNNEIFIRYEFHKRLKINTKQLKLMGLKYRRAKTKRPIGKPILYLRNERK